MNYRTLGMTGLRVSEISIGAFPISGRWTNPDGTVQEWSGATDEEAVALIHRAEDLGVNLIDTAESYGRGHSEELVGAALRGGRRDRWIIATKVSPNAGLERDTPDGEKARRVIFNACEGSLRRLKVETIDLYQLHAIPHEWAMPAAMEALATLRAQGKVRWYGISTNNQEATTQLMRHGPIHLMQIGYNLLQRQAASLLTWCRERNIGTLIRVPLAKGMLTGKYFGGANLPKEDVRHARFASPQAQDAFQKLPQLLFLTGGGKRTMTQAALRFVLEHPGVSTVLAGAKTRAQMEENAAACEAPPFADEERRRAFAIADTITPPAGIT